MSAPRLTTPAVAPAVAYARAVVAPVDRERLVVQLAETGADQIQIAERVGISQPTVHRILRRQEEIRTRRMSPLEVVARAVLGDVSRVEMLRDLTSRVYTSGRIPDDAYDAWAAGSWDDLLRAVSNGMLTRAEFAKIQEASRGIASDAAKTAAPVVRRSRAGASAD